MKILITNHHLRNKAGSEIFTLELAINLKNKGHDVFVFSFDLGEIAEKIKNENIPITRNLADFEKINFDIIHAQHNVTAILARSVFPATPMIFMSHGFLPELEQPPSVNLGIFKYIVVSEEVKNNLSEEYKIPNSRIEIIRNFINIKKFNKSNAVNIKPRKLLVLSNHYIEKVKNIIETACKDLNIEVEHVGLPDNPVEDIARKINEADVVVTLGRGALESMACERNVIIYDMHGGDGLVNEENFFEIRKNNFSGRRFAINYTVDTFKDEVKKYDFKLGERMRAVVKKENNPEIIISKLENIYREAIEEKYEVVSDIKMWQLYNEINFLEKFFKEYQDMNTLLKEAEKKIINKDKEIEKRDQELYKIKKSLTWKIPNYVYKLYLKHVKKFIPKSIFKLNDIIFKKNEL